MSAFLSTLSLRRATSARSLFSILLHFYPRSPCGERQLVSMLNSPHGEISIHALLAESDTISPDSTEKSSLFLSTLSLRRATPLLMPIITPQKDFYPRSPCGERLFLLRKITITVDISIHALLAESDLIIMLYDTSSLIFLSTLSLRRATALAPKQNPTEQNFYPRSPCGERP